MSMFTVFVRESSGKGTTYITSCEAENIGKAKQEALAECAAEWQYPIEDVVVMGVAAGDCLILEWDDEFI